MTYLLRLMSEEDVSQVNDIDREAFPTMLPAPNYHRELQNHLAHYIVALDTEKVVDLPEPGNGFKKVFKFLFDEQPGALKIPRQFVLGFVGMWILVDEAHITSIAVRETHKGRGIGELMLIAIIERAIELNARMVTLEVRVSNKVAQNLYLKYGFNAVGVRKGYYTDNREDALLMSTGEITSAGYKEKLKELIEKHSRRWGVTCYELQR